MGALARSTTGLPDEALRSVAGRLQDEDQYVRRAAIDVLGKQSDLSQEMLH
jgi:Txe/YoeB family toxin of Txe-Axe toxin-antitoxin module